MTEATPFSAGSVTGRASRSQPRGSL